MKPEMIALAISIIAITLTIINIWLTFFHKKPLKVYCSSFTAQGFGQDQDNPSRIALGTRTRKDEQIVVSFAVKLVAVNKGALPKLIQDLIIKAKYEGESKEYTYEPVFLWSFVDQTKSGGEKMIGQSQKGQFDIPFLVPPKNYISFEHHILFMPIDKISMIPKDQSKNIIVEVLFLEKGRNNYKSASKQIFTKEDISSLDNSRYCGVISDDSKSKRNKVIKENNIKKPTYLFTIPPLKM